MKDVKIKIQLDIQITGERMYFTTIYSIITNMFSVSGLRLSNHEQ